MPHLCGDLGRISAEGPRTLFGGLFTALGRVWCAVFWSGYRFGALSSAPGYLRGACSTIPGHSCGPRWTPDGSRTRSKACQTAVFCCRELEIGGGWLLAGLRSLYGWPAGRPQKPQRLAKNCPRGGLAPHPGGATAPRPGQNLVPGGQKLGTPGHSCGPKWTPDGPRTRSKGCQTAVFCSREAEIGWRWPWDAFGSLCGRPAGRIQKLQRLA